MATMEEMLLKQMKDAQAAQAKAAGTPAVPTSMPGSDDVVSKMLADQKAQADKALGTPDGSSPYDTWGGTLMQVGKILGSGLEQAGTSIAGTLGSMGQQGNDIYAKIPPSMRDEAVRALQLINPAMGVAMGARSAGAPTGEEMDKYLRSKGLQYAPKPGSIEDWAQYGVSAAAQGALPIGQEATVANAVKGAATSVLPALAAKGGTEAASAFTDSPMIQTGVGIVSSILAALGQHGVKTLATPSASVAGRLGEDIGSDQLATLDEYKRLGVPAMAADIVPPTSTSSTAIRDAVQDNPRGKARFLLDALTDRQTGGGERIKANITAASGASETAASRIAQIEKETAAIADPIHNDVRVSDLYSNNSKAIRDILPYLRGQADRPTPVQDVMNKVQGYLIRTNDNGVPSPNLEAQGAWAAREYIKGVVAKDPSMKTYLEPIFKKLNGALQLSYPDLPKADNLLALKDARVSAINAGEAAAAKSMNAADVQAEFKALGKLKNGQQLQQDYQAGYGSALKTKVEGTKTGSSGVGAIADKAQGKKMTSVFGPDATQRRDFEITADKTKTMYNVKPNDTPGLMERIRRMPGHGFGAVSMASSVPLALAGYAASGSGPIGLALGATSGVMGLVKSLRDPALASAWIKAAGIKDPDELRKFLLKAEQRGTFTGAATKAGIINALNGAGR